MSCFVRQETSVNWKPMISIGLEGSSKGLSPTLSLCNWEKWCWGRKLTWQRKQKKTLVSLSWISLLTQWCLSHGDVAELSPEITCWVEARQWDYFQLQDYGFFFFFPPRFQSSLAWPWKLSCSLMQLYHPTFHLHRPQVESFHPACSPSPSQAFFHEVILYGIIPIFISHPVSPFVSSTTGCLLQHFDA